MKKILAIAVSFIIVFAAAAGTFAIYGFVSKAERPPDDSIKLSVELYELNTAYVAGSRIIGRYTEHSLTSGVRTGEKYAFSVTLYIPKIDSMTDEGEELILKASAAVNDTTALYIRADNLTGFADTGMRSDEADLCIPEYDTAGMDAATWGTFEDGECEIDLTAIDALEDGTNTADLLVSGGDVTYMFSAACEIDELADAAVTASFGKIKPDVKTITDDGKGLCMIGRFNVTNDYAYPATSSYVLTERDSAGNILTNTVTFMVDGPDAAGNFTVVDTFVDDGADGTVGPHLVAKDPVSGDIIFIDTATGKRNCNVSEVAILEGILNRAMSSAGFTWTPSGVLYDKGFEELAALDK